MINMIYFVLLEVVGIVFLGLIITGHMTPTLWVTHLVWLGMVWIPILRPIRPIRRKDE